MASLSRPRRTCHVCMVRHSAARRAVLSTRLRLLATCSRTRETREVEAVSVTRECTCRDGDCGGVAHTPARDEHALQPPRSILSTALGDAPYMRRAHGGCLLSLAVIEAGSAVSLCRPLLGAGGGGLLKRLAIYGRPRKQTYKTPAPPLIALVPPLPSRDAEVLSFHPHTPTTVPFFHQDASFARRLRRRRRPRGRACPLSAPRGCRSPSS